MSIWFKNHRDKCFCWVYCILNNFKTFFVVDYIGLENDFCVLTIIEPNSIWKEQPKKPIKTTIQ